MPRGLESSNAKKLSVVQKVVAAEKKSVRETERKLRCYTLAIKAFLSTCGEVASNMYSSTSVYIACVQAHSIFRRLMMGVAGHVSA